MIREDLKSTTLKVKDLSTNWANVEALLMNEADLPKEYVDELYESIFVIDGIKLAASLFQEFQPDLCNSTYLQRYLLLSPSSVAQGVTYESLGIAFCGSTSIAPSLAENLRMNQILEILNEAVTFSPEMFSWMADLT